MSDWPSKDAHDRYPEAPRLAPLPDGHRFTRPCPWCGRPLEKSRAGDQFYCATCGWKG